MKGDIYNKLKKHSRGSALGWVLIVVVVIMLVLLVILSTVLRYSKQSSRGEAKTQSLLSVRSVLETIVADFTSTGESTPIKDAILKELTEQASLTPGGHKVDAMMDGISLDGLDESMGDVSLTASFNQDTHILTITVVAKKGESKQAATARLKNMPAGKLDGLYSGFRVENVYAANLIDSLCDAGTPLIITGGGDTDISAETSGDSSINGQMSDIYTAGSITQTMSIDGNTKLGSLITQGDIDLSDEGNKFTLHGGNSLYSLYAYEPNSNKGAQILLSGRMTIDSSDSPKQIVGGNMTFVGGDDAGSGKLVCYDQIKSGLDISISGIGQYNADIISDGNITCDTDGYNSRIKSVFGSQTKPIEMRSGSITLNTTNTTDTIDVYGDIIATIPSEDYDGSGTGDIVIDATSGTITVTGNLIASGKITLIGNVTVTGDMIAHEIDISMQNTGIGSGGGALGPGETESSTEESESSAEETRSPEDIDNLLKQYEHVTVTVSSQMPQTDELSTDKLMNSYVMDVKLKHRTTMAGVGNIVYNLVENDEEDDSDDEDGYSVSAGDVGDTYLLVTDDIELCGFDGYAGVSDKPNGYIVLTAGNLSMVPTVSTDGSGNESVEPAVCRAYVAGPGVISLGEETQFTGILDVGVLDLGEGVSLRYADIKPERNQVFASGWKLNEYVGGVNN